MCLCHAGGQQAPGGQVSPVDGDGGVGTLDAEASEVFEWPCLDPIIGHIQVVE